MIGKIIGNNFRLLEVVGTGAMGTIFKAEQVSLGKTVVIKLLHRHLLGDPSLSKRFHREARAASLLNHPNTIQIIDFGQMQNGPLYIAMEFVPGRDLAEVLFHEFPMAPIRVVNIVRQIASALDEAHANGVLHRDLKPENIMVGDRRNQPDFVKVLDFGIAKLQDGVQTAGAFQTVAGVVCGTPEYMSPEQARGETLDGRSDLYALGVLMYQLLTNRLPFEGESPLAVVTQHLSKEPVPPSRFANGIPPSLEHLTLSLLLKPREERPAAALDVVAELDRIGRELESSAQGEEGTDATMVEIRALPADAVRELAAGPKTMEVSQSALGTAATPPPQQPRRRLTPAATTQSAPTAPVATPPDAPLTARIPGSFKRNARRAWPQSRVLLAALLISVTFAVMTWIIYRVVVPTKHGAPTTTTGKPSSAAPVVEPETPPGPGPAAATPTPSAGSTP
jgi:serine/threonine protein kinase